MAKNSKIRGWVYSKIGTPKNQLFLKSLSHPCHSLSLMFQSSPQITPCLFSLLCHQSKSDKVFLDKRPTSLGLLSYMCITPYPIPEFHFWTVKSKNKTDLHFMTYWHQLDVRCYVSFKVQTFYCEKILFVWLKRRRSSIVNIDTLLSYWEVFCNITEGSC